MTPPASSISSQVRPRISFLRLMPAPQARGYKSIIGDGFRARSSDGQGSEVILGCEILNRMTELGRPVSYRIGR